MLEEILNHIHNNFAVAGAGLSGRFTISSGTLILDTLLPGQFFWIEGSIFNDGLHRYPATDLQDESFTGSIIPAAIPRALQELSLEVEAWVRDHPDTGKASESFGGYSYTSATVDGKPITWQSQFASRLNRWRKLA